MINLKKLFRRKKGQGALEYLFMIAVALIIIFVVVRYISQTGSQATSQSDINILQNKAELVKARYEANGWWDTARVTVKDGSTLMVYLDEDNTEDVTYTIPEDYDELSSKSYENTPIKNVYNQCQSGDLGACQVFALLSGQEQGS